MPMHFQRENRTPAKTKVQLREGENEEEAGKVPVASADTKHGSEIILFSSKHDDYRATARTDEA